MKKQIIILATILLAFNLSYAQKSNLVFYTEPSESFYIILNGIKQNTNARTNININDLNDQSYNCKIIFKNKAYGQLDKTIIINPGTEATYVIRKYSKTKWLISFIKETPLINNNANSTTQTTTTITTTSTTTTNQTESKNQKRYSPHQHKNRNNLHQVTDAVPGYQGPYGCEYPMNNVNFSNAKSSIASKSFENSKLTIAKQVITNNCLTTSQIKEIVKMFDFENTRLEFAKYAYNYVYDKGNYFQLNDVFDFESTINDLNNYININK